MQSSSPHKTPCHPNNNPSSISNNHQSSNHHNTNDSQISIDFTEIYNTLHNYKSTENHLTISPTHPAYTQIIHLLSLNNDIESVIRKHKQWMHNLSMVRSLIDDCANNNKNVPVEDNSNNAPDELDKWIQIQLDHYALYKEGEPQHLCGKQIEMLEEVGLKCLMSVRDFVIERSRKEEEEDGIVSSVVREEKEMTVTQDEVIANYKEFTVNGVSADQHAALQYNNAAAAAASNIDSEFDNSKRASNSSAADQHAALQVNSAAAASNIESEFDNLKRASNSSAADQHAALQDNNAAASSNIDSEFDNSNNHQEEKENIHHDDNDAILRTTKQSTALSNEQQSIKGKCDICRKKDGHQGHNLQKCKSCGLKIHELCYGLIATHTKNPNFQCHACKSVNTTVEVNHPSRIGPLSKKNQRRTMQQKERPTECALCSHDEGMHAMHPLMDTEGDDARQLVLPATKDKPERLAWVHTLCAQFICKNIRTAGCVYGLGEDNLPDMEEGDEEDDEEEEDGSEEDEDDFLIFEEDKTVGEGEGDQNKQQLRDETTVSAEDEEDEVLGDDNKEAYLSGNCSFTIASDKVPGYELWSDRIRENRARIKCYVCGKDDKKSLRIPIQCSVDEGWDRKHSRTPEMQSEFSEFKAWRRNCPEYNPNDVCVVGMHVGCARWGAVLETVAGKPSHQVYFYPGQQTGYDGDDVKFMEVVANCFCLAHARQLIRGNPKNADKLEQQACTNSKKRKPPPPEKRLSPPKKARRNRQFEAAKKKKVEIQRAKKKKAQIERAIRKKTDKANKAAAASTNNHHNPFKTDPGTAAVNTKQEEKNDGLIVLGRSGRAMLKKKNGSTLRENNNTSNESLQEITAASDRDDNEIRVKVKSENDSSIEAAAASIPQGPAKRSLKNLLNMVSQQDNYGNNKNLPSTAPKPLVDAASNQEATRPVHISRNPNKEAARFVLFAQNRHFSYPSNAPSAMHGARFNQPHTADTRAPSSRSLPIKPVGILKKKGSGPIDYKAISIVHADDIPTTKPIIKQEHVDDKLAQETLILPDVPVSQSSLTNDGNYK